MTTASLVPNFGTFLFAIFGCQSELTGSGQKAPQYMYETSHDKGGSKKSLVHF
jgi:hypothetical protein